MADTDLLVVFDQAHEVFFAGQPITGRVILITTDAKYKARAVSIQFEGCAHTNWQEYETVRRRDNNGETTYDRHAVRYSDNASFLKNTTILWASSDGSNELEAGRYEWPFSMMLPTNIPPSFEGKYGYIRYSVKAEVDRPWRIDKAKKCCITVSSSIDLNVIPNAIAPLHDDEVDNIGCCCFKKGYLELRVDIPKTGFVPGETIPINVHILNYSSVSVTEVEARIIQHCTFVAFRRGDSFEYIGDLIPSVIPERKTKYDTKSVMILTKACTIESGKEYKTALELHLPSITPTIQENSPIITVNYLVQITVDTSATFGSSIDCEMPVVIGTVPIYQFLPPAYYPQNPFLPPAEPTPIPPSIGGGIAALPAYGIVPQADGPLLPKEHGGPPYPYGPPLEPCPPYPGSSQPHPAVGGVVPHPFYSNITASTDGTGPTPNAPPLSFENSMYGIEGTELNTDENEKPFVPKYPVFRGLPVYNPTAPPSE